MEGQPHDLNLLLGRCASQDIFPYLRISFLGRPIFMQFIPALQDGPLEGDPLVVRGHGAVAVAPGIKEEASL